MSFCSSTPAAIFMYGDADIGDAIKPALRAAVIKSAAPRPKSDNV